MSTKVFKFLISSTLTLKLILFQHTWKYNLHGDSGVSHLPSPCKYVGQFGDDCDAYLSQIKNQIEFGVGGSLAGFWAEPIQGVGGANEYPEGYLKVTRVIKLDFRLK